VRATEEGLGASVGATGARSGSRLDASVVVAPVGLCRGGDPDTRWLALLVTRRWVSNDAESRVAIGRHSWSAYHTLNRAISRSPIPLGGTYSVPVQVLDG
jgi:hypothetical protein